MNVTLDPNSTSVSLKNVEGLYVTGTRLPSVTSPPFAGWFVHI